METVGLRWKKLTKNNSVYTKLSSTTNGMDVIDYFYTDHPFLHWYKTTQEGYF